MFARDNLSSLSVERGPDSLFLGASFWGMSVNVTFPPGWGGEGEGEGRGVRTNARRLVTRSR